ncbi:TetR family transcriptional regulator C-terminal domain-containing protein [Kribbella solani]|uniref:AcrR family transcriptional regulator n=1 Tax=Kribbella solani TaxID=236067 RepID=A0A841DG47_9ACTN|nr:AcrR family transcriptional regulator [Kribbella solani]
MPRLVDHEQRRREIADAGLRVILERGLDGVTVRGIAAITGKSTGSLRHYFASQDALREFVVQAATDTLRDRVYPRVARPRRGASLAGRVVSILEEFLPIDATRREEYAIWSAVVAWERESPTPGSTTWREQRALYRQCAAALLGYEPERGLTEATFREHDDPEVERWAALLHTFVDGLAAQLVHTPREVTAADARRLLKDFVTVCRTDVPKDG